MFLGPDNWKPTSASSPSHKHHQNNKNNNNKPRSFSALQRITQNKNNNQNNSTFKSHLAYQQQKLTQLLPEDFSRPGTSLIQFRERTMTRLYGKFLATLIVRFYYCFFSWEGLTHPRRTWLKFCLRKTSDLIYEFLIIFILTETNNYIIWSFAKNNFWPLELILIVFKHKKLRYERFAYLIYQLIYVV